MATKKRSVQGRFTAADESEEQKTVAKKKAVKPTKNCKRYAKQRVAEAWPGIVSELVTKAKKGSYNHTKLLMEVSGIKEDDAKPAKRGQGGLSKLLMKKLSEKESDSSKRKD